MRNQKSNFCYSKHKKRFSIFSNHSFFTNNSTNNYHIALWTPLIRLWSAKSLQTIRLNRHRCTTPLGRDVRAQRPRIRVMDESLGCAAISTSAISRNSIGRMSFFRNAFTRNRSIPRVSTHFRFRTSLIICQLAYFVRTCWNCWFLFREIVKLFVANCILTPWLAELFDCQMKLEIFGSNPANPAIFILLRYWHDNRLCQWQWQYTVNSNGMTCVWETEKEESILKPTVNPFFTNGSGNENEVIQ